MASKPMTSARLLEATDETAYGKVIRKDLERHIIGQPEAVTYFVGLIDKYKSRLFDSTRPVGSVLFTGPSGSGKTHSTEMFAECLQSKGMHDWKLNMMRIDCGEFQHSHEVAKLIGSPPGYLGHRETKAMLSTERIGSLQTGAPDYPFAIILFDEIEKASDALWNILLGMLDKASLTLGTNETVDLSKTVIVMTSNAGFSTLRNGGLGFVEREARPDKETRRIGMEAAKRKFSIEFINRLDGVIGFHALTRADIMNVIRLELGKLQLEVFTKCMPKILFKALKPARAALLEEGYDPKNNAREVKRVIDKRLRLPLARILGGQLVNPDEGIVVDYTGAYPDGKFEFFAIPTNMRDFIIHGYNDKDDDKEDTILCTI